MAHYDVSKLFQALYEVVENDSYSYHHIRGNSKLGSIPAANVLPLVTCNEKCMGTCGANGCYAVKNALRSGYSVLKNSCLRAWAENTAMLIYRTAEYFENVKHDIAKYVTLCNRVNKPAYFRIHASGDFYSKKALLGWIDVAKDFPTVKFLAYTKQFDLLAGIELPANMNIILSDWQGIEIPAELKKSYKIAYVDNGENCNVCPGDCSNCKICWHLRELDKNVLFHKH